MMHRINTQRIIISIALVILITVFSPGALTTYAAGGTSDTETVATIGQQNAFKTAKRLLQYMNFSRKALYEQLTSEKRNGYSPEEANYALDKLEAEGLVEWNEQAVRTAEIYLRVKPLTKDALIDLLSNQYGAGFTEEQAQYAADAVFIIS